MKKPFNISHMLELVANAVRPFPKAAMFELAHRGYISVFEQLMACLISIRTLDEVSIPVSERLFAKARTPEELLKLSVNQLAELLHGTQYPMQKAQNMLAIAQTTVTKYNGLLPAEFNALTDLKGVGPKCANLTMGVAAGVQAISVDVHVHRVVNRWGYVLAANPEKTLLTLEQQVPKEKWTDINRLLMPFGKHICTNRLPHCSTCPLLSYCRQVGVEKFL